MRAPFKYLGLYWFFHRLLMLFSVKMYLGEKYDRMKTKEPAVQYIMFLKRELLFSLFLFAKS